MNFASFVPAVPKFHRKYNENTVGKSSKLCLLYLSTNESTRYILAKKKITLGSSAHGYFESAWWLFSNGVRDHTASSSTTKRSSSLTRKDLVKSKNKT